MTTNDSFSKKIFDLSHRSLFSGGQKVFLKEKNFIWKLFGSKQKFIQLRMTNGWVER